MTSIEARNYLAIPHGYCDWMDGLRWCPSGEAIDHVDPEHAIAWTFAMAGEIAIFLEGYCAGGPLPCFGFVLDLLRRLGVGARGPVSREPPGRLADLAVAMREAGRPIRNAGALCAMLCRDVPRAADPPSLPELGLSLRWPAELPQSLTSRRASPFAEVPPLDHDAFAARVTRVLEGLTPDDVRHWLRHGGGPVSRSGEAIARAWTRDFGEVLADLGRRPRLASALPLVERLSGALSLPPRRLARAELPAGGYSDITTRGRPEHLLPAQFALDEIEFLRRFAEHELLFFHREEPRAPTAEELVIVLDQGVRTWGDVRLVLAASALALVRRAARRGTPAQLATTGAPGRLVATDAVDPEALGALLEASDLSPHPGEALANVLDMPAEGPRDVVLLTHPRTLRQPEIGAMVSASQSAHGPTPGTRLFAIAVAVDGVVELSRLSHGAPVVLGRCRVEVRPPGEPEAPAVEATTRDPAAWRGDVEPIGFPFRFGVLDPIKDGRFDFDDAGEWLLAAARVHGMLHAWRVDDEGAEVLPRACVGGKILTQVHAVLGVVRGFLVCGAIDGRLIVAHYDFQTRVCNAHVVDGVPRLGPWLYLRRLHTIVAYDAASHGVHVALDLGVEKGEARRTTRVARACEHVSGDLPGDVHRNDARWPANSALRLDSFTGTIELEFSADSRRVCTPRSDGEPALRGGRIVQVRRAGTILAAVIHTDRERVFVWASERQSPSIAWASVPPTTTSFALTRDARRVAFRVGDRQFEVRDFTAGLVTRMSTPKGRCHSRLDVLLGPTWMAVNAGKHAHLLSWGRAGLVLSCNSPGGPMEHDDGEARDHPTIVMPRMSKARGLGPLKDFAVGRGFVDGCSAFGLTLLVDIFGQVAVLGPDRDLVGMFHFFRDKAAAWLPDGTRIGPLPVIGGPPTPDGPERIARALRETQAKAWARGQVSVWGQLSF